jgi:hypothetical protein
MRARLPVTVIEPGRILSRDDEELAAGLRRVCCGTA